MATVSGELGKTIENLMDQANDEWYKGNYEKCISLYEEAWKEVPEDKNLYKESFMIMIGVLSTSILIKDYNRLRLWNDKIFTVNLERGDYGEREMWAGRVAYELGELPKAKEYFRVADKKSKGRCFSLKNDGKYLKFYKEK